MVRKPTWIFVGIFILLLGLALYLRDRPVAGGVSATPSPTPPLVLLEGWQSRDITFIQLNGPDAAPLELTLNGQGQWSAGAEIEQPVDAGMVEQLRSQIAAIRVMTNLDPGYDRQALGLDQPGRVLTIRDEQGREAVLRFGILTPTGNGYYTLLDPDGLYVISKYTAEALFNLLQIERLVPDIEAPVASETPES